MTINRITVVIIASLAVGASAARADAPPSYARQVKPFLGRYCLECHNAEKLKGGLSLETFKGLAAGGEHGPVLVAGKPAQSRMVLLVEGKTKPHMPPRKARQPKPDEIGVLRAWIAAGAKNDTNGLAQIKIPDVKPRVPTRAAIAALAYRPDGRLLAAGGYREAVLIDIDSGDVVRRLSGLPGEVTALAFSADGHWLAVASGESGRAGEVRLYAVSGGLPAAQPTHVLHAHKDEVLGLAFRPDGKVLATCGYDRLVKLWDVVTGRELRTLKDHSDAVYGVAFSPDGKLLASGSADRAVKVWAADTGRRLYTLGQSTDWVYTVAWSPDGHHLAAAGVDRSIRIWRVSETSGQLSSATFAHEKPIIRLIYSADGGTLYSLSEDRTAKAWDSTRMVERSVYARQPEAALALAVQPDQKQLALGRYDGTVVLIDPATGKVQAEPLPAKPHVPQLTSISPDAVQRGKTIHVLLKGNHLANVTEVATSYPGVAIHLHPAEHNQRERQADLTFPVSTPAGVYKVHVRSPVGQSADVAVTVDAFAATVEHEPNDSATTGQLISLPTSIVGKLNRAGDIDYYRFEALAGQQIGAQAVVERSGTKLNPVLELADRAGRVLATSTTGLLGYTIQQRGTYAVGIRDSEYRGGNKMTYRLHIGNLPIVTGVFPLGLQRGTNRTIRVAGVNLGDASGATVQVQAPIRAGPGTWLPLPISTPLGKPLGNARVVVGEFSEVVRPGGGSAGDNGTMPIPGTANGRINEPGATETWRFAAKKGQRLILEAHARRLGSPLDSFIEILDAQGQPLPRATLRCVSQTFTAFRDHDSSGAGIRLESWSDLAVNDYLLVGTELMKIWALPRNPDDDAQFFSHNGRRIAFLGTTPTYHSLGTPMYKVEIHPPGTQFPPNGLPVVTLYYRNDDGGPGFSKDSMLVFDPPADATYSVRIGDARDRGGSTYGYRLTIRPPRPDFQIHFSPTNPAVWRGGAVPIRVSADRIDGYAGPIDVRLENLPPGLSAPPTFVPAGEDTTALALSADPKALVAPKGPPLKLVAHAHIQGKEVMHTATGRRPTIADPGDISTTTAQSEVTVRPGSQVKVTARIERRHGFKGRVPLEVRGLPHGVHVLDVGLNGILVTEQETSRTFVLYAEPWVRPMAHPFVVLAQREGKGAEHAARSVLLRVEKPK